MVLLNRKRAIGRALDMPGVKIAVKTNVSMTICSTGLKVKFDSSMISFISYLESNDASSESETCYRASA